MLGESGWEVCGGEVSNPSVMFFLQTLRGGEKRATRREVKKEILLSVSRRD